MTDCKTLLPRNNTPLERVIEQVTCHSINQIPIPIRSLWRVDECPPDLLPWLAWALSVDVWDDGWTDARKREVIRNSVAIHKHKGTLYAVELAIASLGIEASITEWFEDKARIRRGRFVVDIGAREAGINSANKQAILRKFIAKAKRLSAHYEVFTNDSARLDTIATSASGSIVHDHNIPYLHEAFATHHANITKAGGQFNEINPPEFIQLFGEPVVAFETSNQRMRYLPQLATRIVSRDADVQTIDRKEVHSKLVTEQFLSVGGQFDMVQNAPTIFPIGPIGAYLGIAFESSNRRTRPAPQLVTRIVTQDIAIATDTRREAKATFDATSRLKGFAQFANVATEPTQLAAQSALNIAFESSNQRTKPAISLSVRIATKHVAIQQKDSKEAQVHLTVRATTHLCAHVDNFNVIPMLERSVSLSNYHVVALYGQQQQLSVQTESYQLNATCKVALLAANTASKINRQAVLIPLSTRDASTDSQTHKTQKATLVQRNQLASYSLLQQQTAQAQQLVKSKLVVILAAAQLLKQTISLPHHMPARLSYLNQTVAALSVMQTTMQASIAFDVSDVKQVALLTQSYQSETEKLQRPSIDLSQLNGEEQPPPFVLSKAAESMTLTILSKTLMYAQIAYKALQAQRLDRIAIRRQLGFFGHLRQLNT